MFGREQKINGKTYTQDSWFKQENIYYLKPGKEVFVVAFKYYERVKNMLAKLGIKHKAFEMNIAATYFQAHMKQ